MNPIDEPDTPASASAADAISRVSFKVRVALIILSFLGLLATITFVEVYRLGQSTRQFSNALDAAFAQRLQLSNAYAQFLNTEISLLGHALTGGPSANLQVQHTLNNLDEGLRELRATFGDDNALAARSEALQAIIGHELIPMIKQLEAAPSDDAMQSIWQSLQPVHESVEKIVEEMLAYEQQKIADLTQQINERVRWSRIAMLVLLSSIVALIMALIILGVHYILRQSGVEKELRRAMDAAAQASNAKTEFLASMSHEIRTPLTGVMGYAELLLEEDLSDRQRGYASKLQSASETLAVIVNDILDFSKIEAGELQLENRPFSPGVLIANMLSVVSVRAKAGQIDLQCDIDPEVPQTVLGDETRLGQILLNLLNNAVKFTPKGSVTLRVHPDSGPGRDGFIHFAVTDTGIGIPANRLERLFRRFSQVDASAQRKYGGTGLGLAISRRLVRMMGGDIGVESVEGQGSTFWFTVPLPKAEELEEESDNDLSIFDTVHRRILLVEDSLQNQDLVTVMLAAYPWKIDIAGDGVEGVAAAERENYDLILMDMQMPNMDGVEATRLIRQLPSTLARVPIVAMSANVLPNQLHEFRQAGVDDFIAKPFKKAALISMISRWVSPEEKYSTYQAEAASSAVHSVPLVNMDTLREMQDLLGDEWLRDALARLHRALEPADWDGLEDPEHLRRKAHRLVSDAGQLGFIALSEAFVSLEDACRAERDVLHALNQVREAMGATRLEIERLRDGLHEQTVPKP